MHGAGDDTDIGAGAFHHWPLFDMRLQPTGPTARRRCQRASLAAVAQRLAHADALVVGDGERILQHHVGGVHTAAHHRRTETAAFLVGPVHQFERRARDDAGVVQYANHFQTGEHAEYTVEAPAGRHGVEMAAKGDRRRGGVTAIATQEHVADRILLEAQLERTAPVEQQRTGFGVFERKRQAAAPAFGCGADTGDVHDRLPQSVCIDRRSHEVPRQKGLSLRVERKQSPPCCALR